MTNDQKCDEPGKELNEGMFSPFELQLRSLLCNGTTDCENDPECPENVDGCAVAEVCLLHEKELEKQAERIREALSRDKILAVFCFGQEATLDGISKLVEGATK